MATYNRNEWCPACESYRHRTPPPIGCQRWELRSALRWGSQHAGYFKTEDTARMVACQRIAEKNQGGRITHVERYSVGGVVYFDEFEEMS